MNKIEAFEYFVYKLTLIQKDLDNTERAVSYIKARLLLFFASAASTKLERCLFDVVFDNFWAAPFGPLEKDIHSYVLSLSNNNNKLIRLNHLSIDNKIGIMHDTNFQQCEITDAIDAALGELLKQNGNIVNMRPFDLVDLSKKWFCWQRAYRTAQIQGRSSEKMDMDEIKKDRQVYHLYYFVW